MREPTLLYVDEAHRVLFGERPRYEMCARDRMERVMTGWDRASFQSAQELLVATLALCQIGLRWHVSDCFSYTFEQVIERLREIDPRLHGPLDGRDLQRILRSSGVPISKDVRL